MHTCTHTRACAVPVSRVLPRLLRRRLGGDRKVTLGSGCFHGNHTAPAAPHEAPAALSEAQRRDRGWREWRGDAPLRFLSFAVGCERAPLCEVTYLRVRPSA